MSRSRHRRMGQTRRQLAVLALLAVGCAPGEPEPPAPGEKLLVLSAVAELTRSPTPLEVEAFLDAARKRKDAQGSILRAVVEELPDRRQGLVAEALLLRLEESDRYEAWRRDEQEALASAPRRRPNIKGLSWEDFRAPRSLQGTRAARYWQERVLLGEAPRGRLRALGQLFESDGERGARVAAALVRDPGGIDRDTLASAVHLLARADPARAVAVLSSLERPPHRDRELAILYQQMRAAARHALEDLWAAEPRGDLVLEALRDPEWSGSERVGMLRSLVRHGDAATLRGLRALPRKDLPAAVVRELDRTVEALRARVEPAP